MGRVGARRRSGIPRSTGTSREPSPSRNYGVTPPTRGARVPMRTHVRPTMTEQILKQSREAESALADALVSCKALSCLSLCQLLLHAFYIILFIRSMNLHHSHSFTTCKLWYYFNYRSPREREAQEEPSMVLTTLTRARLQVCVQKSLLIMDDPDLQM